MADILTLPQARAALGWKDGQNPDRDDELATDYIPATTRVIEAWCGRMEDRVERWYPLRSSPILTPWPNATILSVKFRDDGAELTDWEFAAGVLTITDGAYTAGDRLTIAATDLPTPPEVVLAAKIILAHNWNADKQGRGSTARGENEVIPSGFVMPRRAEALLNPYWHFGGFA